MLSKNQVHIQYSCDIVLLGLQGTGKSFFVKQLQSFVKGNDVSCNHHDLIPSFGVNLDDISVHVPSFVQSLNRVKQSKHASSKKSHTNKHPGSRSCVQWDDFLNAYNQNQSSSTHKMTATSHSNHHHVVNLRIREVGGGMLLGWHKYTGDCRMIIYMIDLSNKFQLAASCTELLRLINCLKQSEDLERELQQQQAAESRKHLLVLLNKTDAPSCIPLDHFLRMTRWDDIVAQPQLQHRLHYLTCSSFTGDGFENLIIFLLKTLFLQTTGMGSSDRES